MKNINTFLIGSLCCVLLLAGCGRQQALPPDSLQDGEAVEDSPASAPPAVSMDEVSFDSEDADTDWSEDARNIALNGGSIAYDGTGAAVDGSTITITEAGTYLVSGSLDDGAVIVDADGRGPSGIERGRDTLFRQCADLYQKCGKDRADPCRGYRKYRDRR